MLSVNFIIAAWKNLSVSNSSLLLSPLSSAVVEATCSFSDDDSFAEANVSEPPAHDTKATFVGFSSWLAACTVPTELGGADLSL